MFSAMLDVNVRNVYFVSSFREVQVCLTSWMWLNILISDLRYIHFLNAPVWEYFSHKVEFEVDIWKLNAFIGMYGQTLQSGISHFMEILWTRSGEHIWITLSKYVRAMLSHQVKQKLLVNRKYIERYGRGIDKHPKVLKLVLTLLLGSRKKHNHTNWVSIHEMKDWINFEVDQPWRKQ